jgi:hypothetical protein
MTDQELLAAIEAAPSLHQLCRSLRTSYQTVSRRIGLSPALAKPVEALRERGRGGNKDRDEMRGESEPPRPYAGQDEADAVVAEALADAEARGGPLSDAANCRQATARLMVEMWNVQGSWNWPRGWVRPFMLALDGAGFPTTREMARWHRCHVRANPDLFRGVDGIDVGAIDALIELYD